MNKEGGIVKRIQQPPFQISLFNATTTGRLSSNTIDVTTAKESADFATTETGKRRVHGN